MKILLINPLSSRKQPIKGRSSHFPVGLGYIASYLIQNNISVDILDNEVRCLNKYELTKYIQETDYDFYGLTGMSGNYNYIKGLSRIIKENKNKPIILGGPLATYSAEIVLNNTNVDTCVIGEGEETILDLLSNYDRKDKVTGIIYKENGAVIKNKQRIYSKSRSEYPFPAYHLFDMKPYLNKLHVQYDGLGSEYLNKDVSFSKNIGIITGIGCPYKCRFCSRSIIKPRFRSIDNIIDEIKYCIKHYNIDGVRFLDDLLLVNEKRTQELCEKIAPLNMMWSGQARTNSFDMDIAAKIKKAGCIGIGFGFESGCDHMLTAMNKKTTVQKHKNATEAAKKNGLAIRVQLLYGFPGENKESIENTIQFFKEIEIPPRRFNILTPLPGSVVYDNCIKDGIIDDEISYLTSLSNMQAGFDAKKVLVNLTDMTDYEFEKLLDYAETTMEKNYLELSVNKTPEWKQKLIYIIYKIIYRLKNPKRLFLFIKNRISKTSIKITLNKEEIEELYFKL